VYCKEHVEELFSPKCDDCKKPLTGQYVETGGKKYHENCFKQVSAKCCSCNGVLEGGVIKALGKTWHEKCFRCTGCKGELPGNFVEKEGNPYCSKCMSKDLGTQQKSINPSGKIFCAECGKLIAGEAVTVRDSTFHSDCFICNKCKTPLANKPCSEVEGVFYCAQCSASSGKGGSFCAGCGKVLIGKYIGAMGTNWHRECFVCTTCKKQFQGGFSEKNGGIFGFFYCLD